MHFFCICYPSQKALVLQQSAWKQKQKKWKCIYFSSNTRRKRGHPQTVFKCANCKTRTHLISVTDNCIHKYVVKSSLESVQDVLIELDMKPCMHLVEISIFSLNHVIVRLTKIMNNLLEHLKIRTFKVIFLCQKLVESFQKKFYEEYSTRDKLLLKKCFWNFWFLRYFIF